MSALIKGIVFAFGIPAIAIGSLRVVAYEIENRDLNRMLDGYIVREDILAAQHEQGERLSPSAITSIIQSQTAEATVLQNGM